MGKRGRRRFFRSGHAYGDIERLFSTVEPKGLCLDLPCGRGVNIPGLKKAGFKPVAADIYPEHSSGKGAPCVKASFSEPLPFGDETFAAVLCSEGIEHCGCQLQLLREFDRILVPGGTLIITTPNILSLRARLSYLINGHHSFARAPITEVTQLRSDPKANEIYVGHVYLANYFELRFMLKVAGFGPIGVTSAKYSASSALMAPLLWPLARVGTEAFLRKGLKGRHLEIGSEILAHTMSADMLFGKKLILTAQKPSAGQD